MELVLRPRVPMYCLQGLGPICALGVCDGLRGAGEDAQIVWPQGVVGAAGLATEVRTGGGFDDEGVFVRVTIEPDCEAADVAGAVERRVEAWAAAIAAQQGAVAGPLVPVLGEYVDLLRDFGDDVEVVYPNGNLAARGNFAGVDVWGRATVRTASGRDLDVSPEQASLRPAL